MNFFNKINQYYIKYEENKKDVNFNSFNIARYTLLKLLLIIINKKPDYEFTLFYNSYLSKFKFKKVYYEGYLYFDRFIDINDFINKVCSYFINNEDFYNELNQYLIPLLSKLGYIIYS